MTYQEWLPAMPTKSFGMLANKVQVNKWNLMHSEEKQSMTLLPNPATSTVIVTVELDNMASPARFQITDLMGQMVFSQDLQSTYNTITVPLDRFNPGLYLCTTFQSGKAIFNSKLTVVKNE
jgi:hypothetical protein